ncbi:MAG: putative transposase/invertase (TIGR01784 family), partial [Phenylobacterium sp.]
WIYFLKNEEIKDEFHAQGLNEAKEKLDLMKLSVQEQQTYNRHLEALRRQRSLYKSTYVVGIAEGREAGRKEGLEEGREEGLTAGRDQERLAQQQLHHQEKIGQAKIMLKNGLKIEQVALFTSLSIEELKNHCNDSAHSSFAP